MSGYDSYGEYGTDDDGASIGSQAYDDDHSDRAYREEDHIAATIIQCMVRRDQAIMFVDVLWEQTAAALSLQAVARAFLTRCKFNKLVAVNKKRGRGGRKYWGEGVDDGAAARGYSDHEDGGDGGGRSTADGCGDSDWEERYYTSSPEQSMFKSQVNSKPQLGRQSKTIHSLANASPDAQSMFHGVTTSVGDKRSPLGMEEAAASVPVGAVAAQRRALELEEAKNRKKTQEEAAAVVQPALGREAKLAAVQEKLRLAKLESAAYDKELGDIPFPPPPRPLSAAEGRSTPSGGSVCKAFPATTFHLEPLAPVDNKAANNNKAPAAVESREVGRLKVGKGGKWIEPPPPQQQPASEPHSPTRQGLHTADSVRKTRDRFDSGQGSMKGGGAGGGAEEEDEEQPVSPTRASLAASGVTQRATARLREESVEKRLGLASSSSKQNDAGSVVAAGALVRAAQSFGNSLVQGKNGLGGKRSGLTENDTASSVAAGQAEQRRCTFEAAANAAKLAKQAAEGLLERAKQKGGFKHDILQSSHVTPLLSQGSSGMSGMERVPSAVANPIMRGAALALANERGGSGSSNAETPLLSLGSAGMSGMARAPSHFASADPITRGAKSNNKGSGETPMLSLGSSQMSGMERSSATTAGMADPITFGAANKAVGHGEVSLFALGSTYMPGMQQQPPQFDNHGNLVELSPEALAAGSSLAAVRTSENMLGTAAGKSVHHGATFVTAGSLHAPGMAKTVGQYVSPEVAGALASGQSQDATGFGTLLTNGSVNAPGMQVARAGTGGGGACGGGMGQASVDGGLSLFAMGSLLSQSKAEEARQAAQQGMARMAAGVYEGGGGGAAAAAGSNTFGATFKAVGSSDLPLWSLGSSVSVAALAESSGGGGAGGGAAVASGNTFGAVAGDNHRLLPTNSEIPLWSVGSASAPGMQKGHASASSGMVGGVRSNTAYAANTAQETTGEGSRSVSTVATLLSLGSSAAPGMARENVAFTASGGNASSGIMLGASAAAAALNPFSSGQGSGEEQAQQANRKERWAASSQPSLLMMGSASAPGMKRDHTAASTGGFGRTITAGAAGGAGLVAGAGAGAAGLGGSSKWGGVGGAATFASYDPTKTAAYGGSFGGFDGTGALASSSSQQRGHVEGIRSNASAAASSGQSIDTFGGTMVTTGSANQMPRMMTDHGMGRSIMHGAGAKPLYSGATFSTGGSAKQLDASRNTSTFTAATNNSAAATFTAADNGGSDDDDDGSSDSNPPFEAFTYVRRGQPHLRRKDGGGGADRGGELPVEASTNLLQPKSYDSKASPERQPEVRAGLSAGQAAVDRAMARARSAAAVIAASITPADLDSDPALRARARLASGFAAPALPPAAPSKDTEQEAQAVAAEVVSAQSLAAAAVERALERSEREQKRAQGVQCDLERSAAAAAAATTTTRSHLEYSSSSSSQRVHHPQLMESNNNNNNNNNGEKEEEPSSSRSARSSASTRRAVMDKSAATTTSASFATTSFSLESAKGAVDEGRARRQAARHARMASRRTGGDSSSRPESTSVAYGGGGCGRGYDDSRGSGLSFQTTSALGGGGGGDMMSTMDRDETSSVGSGGSASYVSSTRRGGRRGLVAS